MGFIVFIPSKIDIDELIQSAPEEVIPLMNPDIIAYILAAYTEHPYKPIYSINPVPSATTIRKIVGDGYTLHRDLLLFKGILYRSGGYIPDQVATQYSVNASHGRGIKPYEITDEGIVRRKFRKDLEKQKEFYKDLNQSHWHLTKWFFNGKLKIDRNLAIEKYMSLSWKDEVELNGRDETLKKQVNALWAVDQLHFGTPALSKDPTVGRFHSPITGLKKELRQFVTYDDKKLISFDISNANSFFLSVLMNPDLHDSTKVANLFLSNFISLPIISKSLPWMFPKIVELSGNEDFNLFRQLSINGELYEYLKKHVVATGREKVMTYKRLKNIIYRTFFSDPTRVNSFNATPVSRFQRNFPSVFEIINAGKTEGYQYFSHLLMRLESELIVENITRNFNRRYPTIPIFTIHDNIATIEGKEGILKQFFDEQCQELMGIVPSVKMEPWGTVGGGTNIL